MSKNPILINVARGELINEDDLVAALDNGQISAAGLDVLQDESPDLTASSLCGRDNVVLTPHVAFYSDASIRDNRTISAQNIRHHLDGNHDAVRHYIHKVTN
jgi:phosphoglycerate dehydrogenase-like enzyme